MLVLSSYYLDILLTHPHMLNLIHRVTPQPLTLYITNPPCPPRTLQIFPHHPQNCRNSPLHLHDVI